MSVPITKKSESPTAPTAVKPATLNVGVVSLVRSSLSLTPLSDPELRSTAIVVRSVAVLSIATGFESVVEVILVPAFAARSEKLNVNMNEVEAWTLGSHGETMVPAPSQCKVDGKPLTELLTNDEIEELVKRTSDGGAEIVALLKTGSAYFAPSSAAATMVKSIISDSNNVLPSCSWVSGEYGISDVYLGVPTKLGKDGVTEIVELDLNTEELENLKSAADSVKQKVLELKNLKPQ